MTRRENTAKLRLLKKTTGEFLGVVCSYRDIVPMCTYVYTSISIYVLLCVTILILILFFHYLSIYLSIYLCIISDHGDFVKSLIFGGLDGIITTFAIVAAVAGSDMDTDVVILMGIANLMADGISMGLGDYLSEVAENNFVNKEREREMWYVWMYG